MQTKKQAIPRIDGKYRNVVYWFHQFTPGSWRGNITGYGETWINFDSRADAITEAHGMIDKLIQRYPTFNALR